MRAKSCRRLIFRLGAESLLRVPILKANSLCASNSAPLEPCVAAGSVEETLLAGGSAGQPVPSAKVSKSGSL